MRSIFLRLLLCPVFFFFCPLFSQESNGAAKGGQEVEEAQVEEPTKLQKSPETPEEEETSRILEQDALASDVVGERPPPLSGPTPVKVALYVDDIALLNDAQQTFTADIRLLLRWVDSRLVSKDVKIRKFKQGEIWDPLIRIANGRDLKKDLPDEFFVDDRGQVIYAQRYSGTFTVPLNLQDFPLDKHQLEILVRSFFTPNEVELSIDQKLTGWAKKLSIPDWIASDAIAKIDPAFSEAEQKQQSQFTFSFHIKRRVGFYFWKVILPLSLIAIMSWGVFWIQPERLEAQIGISATAFLTLFAYQFAIAAYLPRIAYLTRMDRFTMLCSLLVLLALFQAIFKGYLVKKKEMKQAVRLDLLSRALFPAAFLLITLYAFFW